MNTLLNLKNTQLAFRYKNNSELRTTYYVFRLLQKPSLVKVLSALALGILKYRLPLKPFIRHSVFKLFCAGETLQEAFVTIKKLEGYGVKSVLDYVAEGEKTEQAFESNAAVIESNVYRLGMEAPGNAVSVKLSGLADLEVLKSLNALLVEGKEFNTEPYVVLVKRLHRICMAAAESGVTVYIDAEDRFVQDLFDHLAEKMMQTYNQNSAVVYNTLQMYLCDRPAYLERLLNDARTKQYVPGIKLVRGAYAEKERETARREGKPSPVYESKEETDKAFNDALERCIGEHSWVYTCIASHNELSTQLAVSLIERYQIKDHYRKVTFSQLYGMRDRLSFNLAAHHYHVSKYLPYGELHKAIPYLIRRAEENASVGPQLVEELQGMALELTRRKSEK